MKSNGLTWTPMRGAIRQSPDVQKAARPWVCALSLPRCPSAMKRAERQHFFLFPVISRQFSLMLAATFRFLTGLLRHYAVPDGVNRYERGFADRVDEGTHRLRPIGRARPHQPA